MTELLKSLRLKQSFTQKQVASILGVSRQSYSKYENGSVTPPLEIIEKLASLYGVEPAAFFTHKRAPVARDYEYTASAEQTLAVASPEPTYNAEQTNSVASPAVSYAAKTQQTYDAYFDGNNIQLFGKKALPFAKGQRFTIVVDNADNAYAKKEAAKRFLLDFIKNAKPHNDFDYKESIAKMMWDKYESLN